jgi:Leucine-rich repeat (LRR) protein
LPDNKIRVIKKAAFKNLPRLMTLDLSSNDLVRVYSKGFEGLDNLQTLSLQYNKLRSLAKVLDNNPNIYQVVSSRQFYSVTLRGAQEIEYIYNVCTPRGVAHQLKRGERARYLTVTLQQ